jgi:hypothetical protein
MRKLFALFVSNTEYVFVSDPEERRVGDFVREDDNDDDDNDDDDDPSSPLCKL